MIVCWAYIGLHVDCGVEAVGENEWTGMELQHPILKEGGDVRVAHHAAWNIYTGIKSFIRSDHENKVTNHDCQYNSVKMTRKTSGIQAK